jgi:hypothetical protein
MRGLVALLAEQPQRRLGDRAAGLLALAAPPPGPVRPEGRSEISGRVEIRQVELVDGVHVRWHGRHPTVTVSVRGRQWCGRSFNRNLNAFKPARVVRACPGL